MSDRGEKARDDFVSEAQEIIEQLNRDLLAIASGGERPGGGRVAHPDPELINSAFRAVHSLKGLAGLFGVSRMLHMSHQLEDLLDALRLGRVQLSSSILDLLFEAVEHYQRIIAETGQGMPIDAQSAAVDEFVRRLDAAVSHGAAPVDGGGEAVLGGFDLDPKLLAVLTEYEEHRLRENIREGRQLYRILANFSLQTIDQELENLKGRLKPVGEVITYLPGSSGSDPERIDLEVMLGSSLPLAQVVQAVSALPVQVVPVARRPPPLAGAPSAGRVSLPAVERPHVADLPPRAPRRSTAGPGSGETPLDSDQTSLKSVAQTVRVDIRKLDHLMNLIGELALARGGIQTIQNELKRNRAHTELARALQDELRLLSRKLDELQAGILEVRMVPLGQVFDKLSRVVRKLSREAGKEIRFVVSGADTELDKLIVEELSDPLMHVIRNAIDHGIEPASVRAAAGKPAAGTVAISAEQRGNHVVLEIEDDGAGIDGQALVSRAVARGLLTEEQSKELSQREIYNLVFLPGLSTRDVADEISGRGVGMDVVKTNIARMSGIIDLDSQPRQGTRITITLPITLAIIQALVIRCAGRTYAIPLNSVMESLMLDYDQIRTIERREVITLRQQILPLLRLEEVFQLRRPQDQPPPQKGYVVVVALAQHRLGLLVDDLVGQQDIVIKSLGRALQGIPGIAGATELGGQQTALVLDVRALAEEAMPRAVEAA
ncbi:MAG: chemotaxis protein CheA [Myxococcales bacterium]|nr:chemotaxis protein CheA [Myxococcota bacterium]MDW8281489.1 chemotaxis protein CheA [Myxococcales bacterium]